MVEQVVKALEEVFSGASYADKIIERTLKTQKKWGARDRKFFAESVYECVRWRRRLEALIEHRGPMNSAAVMRIWTTWAFEHGWISHPEDWGIHPHEFEARLKKFEATASRAVRESIPDWLDQLGEKELGDRWPAVLKALNEKAPVDLRANSLKTTREDLRQELNGEGIETDLIPGIESGLTLRERKNVFITKAFQGGLFEVQDRASQLVAPLLDPQPGERICDACAGAGGKTLHIAALMKNKGRIVAMDIHDWKLNELRTRASRAGVQIAETRVIESTKTIKRQIDSFDRVLLDVPCSGLGVLRRNPDSKWKLTLEEFERLRALQAEILASYSRMVKPGGILVYATCSFLPSENNQQVEKFLTPEWTLLEQVRVYPDQGRGDGFYAAKMRKKPEK
jgi:16S rRNA (cytosine967-C5)-methyltransferase